ncbi:MAG: hypothetical protein L0H93_09300 [Nocardioides sp.]|nr:hypothetical protein [Nocardioides sp.]
MDINSMYFDNAEIAFRKEKAFRNWAPVRRRRKMKERFPHPRRPLDQDFLG